MTLYSGTELGSRVRVHAGARLGSDGFGYVYRDGAHVKIPHVGRCLIEDDVEIGANTTIDRGSIDDTVIGAGTKIDNLVHIAHNVRIGRLCLIMAQVGIAGSVRVEDGCILAGQVGHLRTSHDRARRATRGAGGRVRRYPGRRDVVGLSGAAASGGAARAGGAVQAAVADPRTRAARSTRDERTTSADAAHHRAAGDASTGIGLHLGVAVHARVPSRAERTRHRASSGATLPGAPPIPALAEHAVLTERRTQLGEEPNAVHTVEHVLAAVARARASTTS